MVLVPCTPLATRSTQFMSNPFNDLVEVETLSPANPATSETPFRKETQWEGV